MDDSVYFILLGALLGMLGPIITMRIQMQSAERRERARNSTQVAIEEWKLHYDYTRRKGGVALPISVYTMFYNKFQKLMEDDNVNEASFKQLVKEHDELIAIMNKHYNPDRRRRMSINSNGPIRKVNKTVTLSNGSSIVVEVPVDLDGVRRHHLKSDCEDPTEAKIQETAANEAADKWLDRERKGGSPSDFDDFIRDYAKNPTPIKGTDYL
jgi:hypothetical protein